MLRIAKLTAVLIVLSVLCYNASIAYEIPRRQVELKPYVHFLFSDDLLRYEGGTSLVTDKTGIGVGLKIRTQLTGPFGLTLDASVTGGETENGSRGEPVIFTAGPYYTYDSKFGNVTVEVTFGSISVADTEATILLPALEYGRAISDRLRLSGELSLPIANDWFYDYQVSENVGSLALSIGMGFIL